MVSLGQQTFCSTNPHFFKVILEHSSLDLKLEIPKKFVTKYGKDLTNSVCLKLPSGFEWEVKFIRCKSKAWFEKGWPEFYRFCSLAYGNFLVFRYEGNSTFEVCIFDRTCTEIDYPIIVSKIDEDVDEDDDFSPCLRTREKPSLIVCHPRKKMRTSSSTVSDRISESGSAPPYPMVLIEKSLANKDSHCSSSELKAGEGNILAKKNTAGGSVCTQIFFKQSLDQEVIGNSLQRAPIFKPDDIPFFKISMNSSNIRKSILSLPYKFSDRYLTKLPAGIATLQVSSGRTLSVKTWSVKFKYDRENSKAQLLNGWSEFVRDNNLKVGDMCGFFLVDSFALLFEVALPNVEAPTITKSAGRGQLIQVQEKRSPQIKVEPECDMGDMCSEIDLPSSLAIVKKQNISGQATQRLQASSINLDAAKEFDSENPFFLVTLGLLHKEKSNVFLPASFVKSFIKEAKQTVKLQINDRSWPVKLFRYGTKTAKFSGGWAAFAKEHQLAKGDICIFELIEINEIVMKVHIFRC